MSGPEEATTQQSHWKSLRQEIKKRCYLPLSQPAFILYFFFVIVIVGGLGVFIKLYRVLSMEVTPQDTLGLAQDLSTYLLAMIAASFVDLDFSESSNLTSLRMFGFALLLIGAMFGIISQITTNSNLALGSACAGTALALFLWWIANYDNSKLMEKTPDPNNPMGGNPDNIKGNPHAQF